MLKKLFIIILFSSLTSLAQYTSQHTGEHIDSTITALGLANGAFNVTENILMQDADTLKVGDGMLLRSAANYCYIEMDLQNGGGTGLASWDNNILNIQSNGTTVVQVDDGRFEIMRPYQLLTQKIADFEWYNYIDIGYTNFDNSNFFMEIGDADSAGNKTAIWIDDPNQTIYLNANNVEVSGTINGVRKYVALLTQSGTNNPTAVVLENTTGYTITWYRIQTGKYQSVGIANYYYCGIYTYSDGDKTVFADNELSNTLVEIRFYGSTPTNETVAFFMQNTKFSDTYNWEE